MTFQIFLVFLILGFVLLAMMRWRLASAFLIVAAMLFFGVGQGWIGQWISADLQPGRPLKVDSWKARNAIVVLGAGTVQWPEDPTRTTHPLGFSRLHQAAKLYLQCKHAEKICKIVATGGDPRKNGTPEAEVMKSDLADLGILKDDILTEVKSNNTYQNAQFTSELLKKEFFDMVVLVTSGAHVKRSLLYFSHFGIAALGAPSDRVSIGFFLVPTAQNFAVTDLLIHEYTGLLRYHLYNVLGWNVESSSPGSP